MTNIQAKEVPAIRRAWEDRGRPPCDHPRKAREYDLGSHTGDEVCLSCGAVGFPPLPPEHGGSEDAD
jgi:hypothetical protein